MLFDRAAKALEANQPRRARALMQLGAPLQIMALSRAMMRWGKVGKRKKAEENSDRTAEKRDIQSRKTRRNDAACKEASN